MLLTIEGDQVPVIPLVDVVGKIGAVVFSQNELGSVNVGVVKGVTVTE